MIIIESIIISFILCWIISEREVASFIALKKYSIKKNLYNEYANWDLIYFNLNNYLMIKLISIVRTKDGLIFW